MRVLPGKLLAGAAAAVVIAAGGLFAVGGSAVAESAAPAAAYEVGKSYFGANGYIEYFPGNAPVILTAPHGGALKPDSIPDRTQEACGGERIVLGADTNTAETVLAMREAFFERYGTYPHVIINRLARRKLDANRPIEDAACGNADAQRAFGEWHAFIDAAKAQVVKTSGKGWYMDIHGHGHEIQRLELGYLVTTDELNRDDAQLDADKAINDRVSIRALLQGRQTSLSAQLRGPSSLGTLYTRAGFPSIPSAGDRKPGEARYFNGGYNTRRHGCGDQAEPFGGKTGDAICGMQIEANFKGVRDTPESRKRFGEATAQVLGEYLGANWGLYLTAEAAKVRAAK